MNGVWTRLSRARVEHIPLSYISLLKFITQAHPHNKIESLQAPAVSTVCLKHDTLLLSISIYN